MEGFNVNFDQKTKPKNVSVSKIRKFVNDIDSGKINNKKSAIGRYLKDIYPDKKYLDGKNIVKETVIKNGKNKGKKTY